MKRCSKCNKEKEPESFYYQYKSKGVLHSWCKTCTINTREEKYPENVKTRIPNKVCKICKLDKLLIEYKKYSNYKNRTVKGTNKVCKKCVSIRKARSYRLLREKLSTKKDIKLGLSVKNNVKRLNYSLWQCPDFKSLDNKKATSILKKYFNRHPTSMEILFFKETGRVKRDEYLKLTEDKIFEIKQKL